MCRKFRHSCIALLNVVLYIKVKQRATTKWYNYSGFLSDYSYKQDLLIPRRRKLEKKTIDSHKCLALFHPCKQPWNEWEYVKGATKCPISIEIMRTQKVFFSYFAEGQDAVLFTTLLVKLYRHCTFFINS